MSILFFDTETTGLPLKKNYKQTKWYLDYPHIVQFSWIVYNFKSNKIITKHDYIIKMPENISIPQSSTNIHGITNLQSQKYGHNIKDILDKFILDMDLCDTIVAHNLEFDIKMIKAEMLRNLGINYFDITNTKTYCTMMNSIDLCKIRKVNSRGKIYNKYPKLSELHLFLYGYTPENLHNSFNDVLVCLRCYYQLVYAIDILEKNNNIKKLFDSKL
jgi:DNA polymerase III epsilon subunit-like protein